MKSEKRRIPRKWLTLVAVLTASAVGAFPQRARAHCDTLDGPVVKSARLALERRDPTPVLGWVNKGDEAEVMAAFRKALAVRARAGDARELADTWFFETVVRLHRAGEGAPFTGLKPAGADLPPAVAAADAALEGRRPIAEVAQHVSSRVQDGIEQRFARALERRKAAGTGVEAGREYVEAYVDYVHYVEAAAALGEGNPPHGAGEEAARAAHAG